MSSARDIDLLSRKIQLPLTPKKEARVPGPPFAAGSALLVLLIAGLAGLLIAVELALLAGLLTGLALLLAALLAGLRLVLMLLLLVLLARRIVLVRHVILQALGLYQPNQEMLSNPSSFREPVEFPIFHAFSCLAKLATCLSHLQYSGRIDPCGTRT
ncbi:MAG TPA: hypothetical protein VJP60_08060 [Rhizomicrobium sp.]|nr:hypothetical protein [Rhizomicrobium sp.]